MPSPWKRVISAPHDLRKCFFELIDKEIDHHQKYKNGRIFAKMNSLEDPQMIDKLYEASISGVKVRLIIRGICCLVPGVPGLSENIKVKSIVGRYLEHSRIYIFNNNANQRVFLSSADWMTRNFDRRVELLFEIYKEEIKEHIQFVMARCWRDTLKSRFLTAQKTYARPGTPQDQPNIHEFLIDYYGGHR
jgi:polyphosphate kinase